MEFQQAQQCVSCTLDTDKPDLPQAGQIPTDTESNLKTEGADVGTQDNVDVLEVMPQRVCAVVQAFYLVCTSSDTHSDR